MNYVDADNDPHRISRVSTGLGHATRVSFPTDSQEQLTSLMYESSFENVSFKHFCSGTLIFI